MATVRPRASRFSARKCGRGERRDLRDVRHAEDLVVRREAAQLLADDLGHAPADPGVHLVEDERAARRPCCPPRRTGSRAAAARARRPTRSSRAASRARPGSARRGRRRARGRWRAGVVRREVLEGDPEARLLEGEARGAPSRPPRRTSAAAARRRRESDRRRRAVRLLGLRGVLAPALERVLDVRELGPLLLELARGARGSPSRSTPYFRLRRESCSRRVSTAVSRDGSASIDAAASRAAAARSAMRRLRSSASSRWAATRASIAASSAKARAASPRRSAAEPSASERAFSAVSPAPRIRSAWSSRSRSAGRSSSSASVGPTDSISRTWKSSVSRRSSRCRREASRAASRSRASLQRGGRRRDRLALLLRLREGVEQLERRPRVDQLLLRALSVDRDEPLARAVRACGPPPARPRRTRGPARPG